jgi:hypothetical protein
MVQIVLMIMFDYCAYSTQKAHKNLHLGMMVSLIGDSSANGITQTTFASLGDYLLGVYFEIFMKYFEQKSLKRS